MIQFNERMVDILTRQGDDDIPVILDRPDLRTGLECLSSGVIQFRAAPFSEIKPRRFYKEDPPNRNVLYNNSINPENNSPGGNIQAATELAMALMKIVSYTVK